MNKKISLTQFKKDTKKFSKFIVNITIPLDTCASAPICVHYETSEIVIKIEYPETILLRSGGIYIAISQINDIVWNSDNELHLYIISCGYLNQLKARITISAS